MCIRDRDKINPNALLIGFGRRFATYKRAHLLFTDLERLSKIVNNPDYPVQFLFTGKAHPHDCLLYTSSEPVGVMNSKIKVLMYSWNH